MYRLETDKDFFALRAEVVAYAADAFASKRYRKHPYLYHLATVEGVLHEHRCLPVGPHAEWMRPVLLAAWLHDSMEDTGVSFNDVKRLAGEGVAEIVRAVTNDVRGRDRLERQLPVLEDLLRLPQARILKLADRVANMLEDGSMLEKYVAEYPAFRDKLYGVGEPAVGNLNGVEASLWHSLDVIYENNAVLALGFD